MGNVFEDIRTRSKAEGKAEGDHNARVEVALKMIHQGNVSLNDISDLTALTVEEVGALAHKETA